METMNHKFEGHLRLESITSCSSGDTITLSCSNLASNLTITLGIPHLLGHLPIMLSPNVVECKGFITVSHTIDRAFEFPFTVPNLPPIKPVKSKPAVSKPAKKRSKLAMTATERILTKIKP